MTIAIYPDKAGTTAFLHEGTRANVVMISGLPRVEWSFDVTRLPEWLTTLEELLNTEGLPAKGLRDLQSNLQAAYAHHQHEHETIVSEAPSADDLQAYLTSYAAAIKEHV